MNDTPLDMLQIKIERAKELLPEATKHAINSVDWRAEILGLKEKKGYSLEQLEDLELETELLLCGLLNPADYPKKLEEALKITKPQVDLLVNEMNELVFNKIKNFLMQNSAPKEIFVQKEIAETIPAKPKFKIPVGFSNVTPIEKHITSPNIINTKEPIKTIPKVETISTLSKSTEIEVMAPEVGGAVLKTVEKTNEEKTPEIVLTEPVEKKTPVPSPNTAPSISSQKLSGSFQLPTIKTEYSLPSVGKDKITPSISRNTIGSSDPYREIPE